MWVFLGIPLVSTICLRDTHFSNHGYNPSHFYYALEKLTTMVTIFRISNIYFEF